MKNKREKVEMTEGKLKKESERKKPFTSIKQWMKTQKKRKKKTEEKQEIHNAEVKTGNIRTPKKPSCRDPVYGGCRRPVIKRYLHRIATRELFILQFRSRSCDYKGGAARGREAKRERKGDSAGREGSGRKGRGLGIEELR